MNKNDKSYLEFHLDLYGKELYKKGKKVPRFILFWSGYDSDKILLGRTDIEVRDKIKRRILN